MRTLTIANQKGGVGKTTLAMQLGYAAHEAGKRVLLVDMDPQASLTLASDVVPVQGTDLTTTDL
ncbi:MAG: ParA family protein, partial [Burkholderiales bacterium]